MMKEKERALAHIEKIEWIKPIEGADNIELIGLLGWRCISKKNEFRVGDLAVYVEIDSKCNEEDKRFEFLESKHYKVKTMKLGKFNVISQGLALPLSLFPELSSKKIGDDVTKELKITYSSLEDIQRKSTTNKEDKYKAMANRKPQLFKKPIVRKIMKYKLGRMVMFMLFGKKKDSPKEFPKWIIKTDETRCLNGNVKIDTDNGKIRIADIVNKKLNVMIKSYNFDNDKIELKPITSYQKYDNDNEWYEIKYRINKYGNRENSIKCTSDHRFYTNRGYIKASELSINDTIYNIKRAWNNNDINSILGMVIGDSYISIDKRINEDGTNRKEIRLQLIQGIKQVDYLKEKVRLLGGNIGNIKSIKSGYCDNVVYNYTHPVDYTLTNLLYDLGCISNGKFKITKDFCDLLTPQSLAFWYLDDGTLRHRDGAIQQPSIQISTNSESKEENNLLINMLQNKFGIECNYRKDKDYGSIYITVKGTRRFLEIITPYIPHCMRYKTLQEYETIPYLYENKIFPIEERILENNISEIKRKKLSIFSNNVSSYDIEVKDNHNFFANGILTHNCENAPFYLQSEDKWIKTEKLDGTSCTYAVNKTKKGYEFIVCSRNVRQKDRDQSCYHESNIYWELADKYNVKEVLTRFAKDNNLNRVVLQGEGVGNVQGNPYKLDENRLYVFNLIVNGVRYGTTDMADFCINNKLNYVPIIDTSYTLPKTMEEMKLEADGNSIINPKVKREGFVYRSLDGQKSFKNVSREYLLKHS